MAKILKTLLPGTSAEISVKGFVVQKNVEFLMISLPRADSPQHQFVLWKNPDSPCYHCVTWKKFTFHSPDAYKHYLLGLLKSHFFNKINLFSNKYFLKVAEDELTDLLELTAEEFLKSRDYVTEVERDLLDLTITGVNFINILLAALRHVNPKSAKRLR